MNVNTREVLHAVAVAAALIAAGTIKFAGVSSALDQNIVAAAAIVVALVNTYLGATTTGIQKTDLEQDE